MHASRSTLLTAGCSLSGVDDFCKVDSIAESNALPAFRAAEVQYIESQNIEALKEALAKHGPVSVGVDAEPIPFRHGSTLHTCEY
jgi:hypothetical protein